MEGLARFRQVAYGLFSASLLYPNEERFQALAAAAAELMRSSGDLAQFAFFPFWHRFLKTLSGLPGSPSQEESYVRVFMHGPKSALCLPYESVHVAPSGQATGWILALLEQEYASAGLALSPSLKDLPDHISVELEFMAFLCGQEAEAWSKELVEKGVESLEHQASFLGKHMITWIPGWALRVPEADDQGVYTAVAETVRAFVYSDLDLIRILLDRFRSIPSTLRNIAGQYGADGRQRSESHGLA